MPRSVLLQLWNRRWPYLPVVSERYSAATAGDLSTFHNAHSVSATKLTAMLRPCGAYVTDITGRGPAGGK